MIRYMALVWNPADANAAESARRLKVRDRLSPVEWTTSVDAPGLFISTHSGAPSDPGKPCTLPQDHGALIGTFFEAGCSGSHGRHMSRLFESRLTELVASGGRSLLREVWGSYVLFLRDPRRSRVSVMRGPMSILPCFYSKWNGVTLFFCSVEDLCALRLVPLTVNWPSIRAQSTCGDYLTRETGINEISALLCGECIEFGPTQTVTRLHWDPRSVAQDSPCDSFQGAVKALRESTTSVVRSWGSLHRRVLLALSGGLDSSVVLGRLARMPMSPDIVAINFYSRDSGDERRYARSMADLHGVELIEQPRNERVDLRMFLGCARTVSPVLHYTGCDFEPTCLRCARQRGATAIMTGELGDHLFGQGVREEAAAEYLWRKGFGPGLVPVAIDHSLLQRVSIWRGIRSACHRFRSLSRRRHWSLYEYSQDHHPELGRLVTHECLADYEVNRERFLHPWLREMQLVPCGKFLLIHGLIAVTSSLFQSPFAAEDADLFVSPLISQPVVDAALRIPTYFNIHRGEDRSVARHAFAEDLSELVLQRGSAKGTTEIWVRDLVWHNLAFVRETLLEGILVKERILDRRKLEELLSLEVNRSGSFVADALEQLYIECWLRQMTASDTRVAA